MWLKTEGVFGVAIGVSSSFAFLFVLFGSRLNQAGAGNYFLKLAFAGLGHLRGGPAKAAVIASAATGLISGSSIANVVTTGTFTIPLMKRVGFPATGAGAIEVSSSINGVLTPPVMGAVAFLMTEYVGMTYVEVVRTAIVPDYGSSWVGSFFREGTLKLATKAAMETLHALTGDPPEARHAGPEHRRGWQRLGTNSEGRRTA